MRYRLRTLLPGQFGLLSLFVLMTMAAIAFAVIRLPLSAVQKLILLILVWGCFRMWADRNFKHPLSRAERFNKAVLDFVSELVIQAPIIWLIFQIPIPRAAAVIVGLLVAVGLYRAICRLIGAIHTEPTTPDLTPSSQH